jgi:hypothetical protein
MEHKGPEQTPTTPQKHQVRANRNPFSWIRNIPMPMKHKAPPQTPTTSQKHRVRRDADKSNAPSFPSPLIGLSLYKVAARGDIEGVRAFLNTKVDIDAQGDEIYGNPLQVASYEGYEAVVGLLLEKGADVNTQGGHYGNALQAASFKGHEPVVRLLLEKGADVNAQGGHYGNALQAASFMGREALVQLLLEKGADVNVQRDGTAVLCKQRHIGDMKG